eukprot:Mrub_03824.p1 GENE.Mrub_03824~~Mrub_03824.p1  ORF type:complete len:303 (+),score=60.96 Mrub_03824:397-1305(+)
MLTIYPNDLSKFNQIMYPIAHNNLEKCTVFVSKDFFGFSTEFKLISEEGYFLACAKKFNKGVGSYYHLSIYDGTYDKSKGYLGKVRSDATGGSYMLYSNGLSAEESFQDKFVRNELGYMQYEIIYEEIDEKGINENQKDNNEADELKINNKIFEDNPNSKFRSKNINDMRDKKFRTIHNTQLVIPYAYNDKRIEIKSNSNYNYLKNCLNENNQFNTFILENKKPYYSKNLNSYVLKYNNRKPIKSCKNFIMTLSNDEVDKDNENIIQFCKISEDTFALDFIYPLSPIQAFAVSLTKFDSHFV